MPETVLMVSDDPNLLQTRAAVLRLSGVDVLNCLSRNLLVDWPHSDVTLAIVCHTLEGATRAEVMRGIHAHWPAARILQVASSLQSNLGDTDTTSSNPRLLVETVLSALYSSKPQAN